MNDSEEEKNKKDMIRKEIVGFLYNMEKMMWIACSFQHRAKRKSRLIARTF